MTSLLLAVAVATAELSARRSLRSRGRALIVSHGALGVGSLMVSRWPPRSRPVGPARVAWGLGLALFGYPLGRALLGSRSSQPPPDDLGTELAALGLLVPIVEERIWGGLVEPSAGAATTAVLFAAKHGVVDGRWDRVMGLGLFWFGLAQVRRASPAAAAVLHCAINMSGVVIGHALRSDQFS